MNIVSHFAHVWQFVEPSVGADCWLWGCGLSPRIKQRSRGRIVYAHGGGWHFEVMAGKFQVTVSLQQIDCGREFLTRSGEWVPETDPRAKRWLLKALLDAAKGGNRLKDYREPGGRCMSVEEVEWVLRRNDSREMRS